MPPATTALDMQNLRLSLIGRHQAANAAVSLAAIEQLRDAGWQIPESAIRRGLAEVRWPARVEIVKPSSDGRFSTRLTMPPRVASLLQTLDESFSPIRAAAADLRHDARQASSRDAGTAAAAFRSRAADALHDQPAQRSDRRIGDACGRNLSDPARTLRNAGRRLATGRELTSARHVRLRGRLLLPGRRIANADRRRAPARGVSFSQRFSKTHCRAWRVSSAPFFNPSLALIFSRCESIVCGLRWSCRAMLLVVWAWPMS